MLETDIHKQTERWVQQQISQRWECRVYELPKFYRLDWQIMRDGETIGFGEFKGRSYSYAQLEEMGGFMLSLSKFLQICTTSEHTGLPVFLFTKLGQLILSYEHLSGKNKYLKVSRFFKSNRKRSEDIEPAVVIPMDRFKPVNK